MHSITLSNYDEANDAIRDILMMYVDMADAYGGAFGHASNVYIRFDPLKFIDAVGDHPGYYTVDMDLLRSGSAIAILASLYDSYLEHEIVSATPAELEALNSGRLSHFPDIEKVCKDAIAKKEISLEDQWFDEALRPIYLKYVDGFFRKRCKAD